MPNELAEETSPYLLQHKDNPVDWVAWSDQAFERAADEGKLVFLSVGYSTCHWCHVMERESFENEAIAAVMNRHFVCVKVDREERPDVDATYMAFVQATTGQGGWPMSVWLTPDGEPVVGGTYFPPEDRHGRAGFPRMCEEIGRLWTDDRDRMKASAVKVMTHLQEQGKREAVLQGLPGEKVFGDFIDQCESAFDPEWGGWGGAPKFPRPSVPRCLLQLSDRFGGDDEGEACLQMVERTLHTMAAGGMHDQLGGGFHRYSVDRFWHVPHYEKMLYDQGQLAVLYIEAWQATGQADFRKVAEGILDYLLRDLRDSGGAFHAAEDADSLPTADAEAKREGAYWTWSADELGQLLDPKAAAIFCEAYGVQAEGNARPESDPHGELVGQNTLHRAANPALLAERFEMTEAQIEDLLRRSQSQLLKARALRPLPHRDDKIIVAWNGLAIEALAKASRVFERKDYAKAATEAAEFLEEHLVDDSGLLRSWRGHAGRARAFPADYACLIAAWIELHGLFKDDRWLQGAVRWQEEMDRFFWDADHCGYAMRSELAGTTLMEFVEDYDGAEPAPTHVAAHNLLALHALTEDSEYGKRAEAIIRAGARRLSKQAFACPLLLAAYDKMLRGVVKMDVRGDLPADLQQRASHSFEPRAVWVKSSGPGEVIACEGETCRPWS